MKGRYEKPNVSERIETADVQRPCSVNYPHKSQRPWPDWKPEVEIKEVEDKLQVAIVEASKNHTKALEKKKRPKTNWKNNMHF